jgi:predicted acylesterase/phospholipase RssA
METKIDIAIKHIVIAGGGPTLIQTLGAFQYLEKNNCIDFTKIESIYGTSAGAIVSVLLCLKFDWETLNDYIIKRPWHDLFHIKIQSIFDAYTKKGIFDITTIEKCFKPLFDAKDISLDITLEDFYKLSNIELHMYSFEINSYKIEDISYITYPKIKLMTAIQMTCSLPLLITPVCFDNKCFIDGGIISNYPLNHCIQSGKNIDNILGFKNKYSDNIISVNKDTTLLDYLFIFIFKALFSLNTDNLQPSIKYEVVCNADYLNINSLKNALSNIDIRKDLLNNGIESGVDFLNKLNTNLKDSIQELS